MVILIIYIVVHIVDNTFTPVQVCSIPVANAMLNKTLPYMCNKSLFITDDEQYYTHPVDMDIMKCLVSEGHYCSLSGGLCPVQGSTDCA